MPLWFHYNLIFNFHFLSRKELEEGDSGSVIYIKRPRERKALAIYSGQLIGQEHMYEAALLDRALGELNLGALDVHYVKKRVRK